ncbi:MAG: exosome complex protein Rrp42 [Sulfolobales archaeon]|nr:exosome complex protein Rrp42 [Ignisphaera sp.]MCX8199771.1 exosome complex protein Rrp42 [Sulfolobales archaeon]MDW8084991.1 exosome complex protein Rrp42 [Ignisphaera sp.]
MSSTPETFLVPKIKYSAILNVVSKGFHVDRRPIMEYRQINIVHNVAPNADASVLLKLGNTQILAGIKLEIGQPFPDNPDEGVLIVNAEYIPAASPVYEPGPPDENAIELARIIDRSLRESKAIALDKLVILPGKKVWSLWLDVYVLDYDGNLIDASMLASMAALATTYIPHYEVDQATGIIKVDRSKKLAPLTINRYVVAVTINKVGDYMVIDPTGEEEAIASGSITFSISEDNHVVGIQKRGMGVFSVDEIEKALEVALNKGKEIIELLKKLVEATK